MLEQILGQLSAIDARIATAALPKPDIDGGLGPKINETLDLAEVLHRTLSATWALPDVDGGLVRVRLADGNIREERHGLLAHKAYDGHGGPPDGASYASGIASWEGVGPDGIRSGLVVPLGDGSLAVYSRRADAFDEEAAELLTTIAERAEPAVQNAFRYLDVQRRAATDARTGLGSSSAFESAIPREISSAHRHARPLCLIQIDLDDFGEINKATRSLEAGNTVLEEFGARVLATIRGSDTAFRNSEGADEFFLILPETTRVEAEQLYRRLEFELTSPPLGGLDPIVTVSSGLAELRKDDTVVSLRRRAGHAQRIAKENGKNQLVSDDDPRMPPE